MQVTPENADFVDSDSRSWAHQAAIALSAMAIGRAMTLAYVARAGGTNPGDPPEAWLMPLVGDAIVGLTAVVVAFLLWRRPSPGSWLVAVVWSAVAAFDALAALLVDVASPWPDFFMLKLFGRGMFIGAAVMHVGIIYLLARPEVRVRFGIRSNTRV